METSPHCTGSLGSDRRDPLFLLALTVAVLLIHGFHPWAEDGGLYVAGVEYTLNPTLFPHNTAFVTEHLRFSAFAPILAAVTRLLHLPLGAVLLGTYLLSTALMLYAGLRLARLCFTSPGARWSAVSLLAAWWTLPVAGTSLLLMDPYVTARSLSTPLSLLALSFALESSRASTAACALALLIAAIFHPLMAAYGLALVLVAVLVQHQAQRRARIWLALTASTLLLAATLQHIATPELPAARAAAISRYYWFLSQWHLYEWLGLAGPLALFAALGRSRQSTPATRVLCRAALILGSLATLVALLFGRESLAAYPVARLQPLRCFLLLYALLPLLLGGFAANWLLQHPAETRRTVTIPATLLVLASLMFWVQRQTFPASPHLEWPGRPNPNPWVQAFLYARDHTPPDAVFALDARYVNTDGEDAQTFRAIAQRSAIPDFSKDGGEAAITPALAPAWQAAATVTQHLGQRTDAQRDAQLTPLGVTWLILPATTPTANPCPYRNTTVKVCQLRSAPQP